MENESNKLILTSQSDLELLYDNDYKKFYEISLIYSKEKPDFYKKVVIPIIAKRTKKVTIKTNYDKFTFANTAQLLDNSIENSNNWFLNLFLSLYSNNLVSLAFDVSYKGSEKIGLKQESSIKFLVDGYVTDINYNYASGSSRIASNYYMETGYAPTNLFFIKNLMSSNDVSLRIHGFINYDFDLTYYTIFGIEEFYNKILKPLEAKNII
jgi:hypothetical protein